MMHTSGSDAERVFAEEYGRMGELELLKLAASYDSLVEAAQDALRAEFARRKMEPPLIEDDGVLENRRLVTVRRYRDLSEAMVARGVLESAGLFCFLRDENVVRMDWAYSNAVGGISLQVAVEDAAAATDLLNQPMPESIAVEGEADYFQPICPRCGSMEISAERMGQKAAMTSLFVVGLPLPLGVEAWRCHACGARWADDGDDGPDVPVEADDSIAR
jgi:hypothetical protein